jgi:glycosyltransferase involved in cell wall biosynthesis
MTPPTSDILMITYKRPGYLRLSLPRLLETCDEHTRVWLWHNGDDEETLDVVRSHLDHPAVYRFHHSRENQRLTAPTNWMWSEGDADLVSKVDDDCLVTPGWIEAFRQVHLDNPNLGAVGSWRFYDEDFVPELAEPKIVTLAGGHRMMRNHWVQGSGYLLSRKVIDRQGLLTPGTSFPQWCIDAALNGAVHGWLFPFVHEEHMDDPRSEHTLFKTDEDLLANLPLSAQTSGVRTVAAWEQQMRNSAYNVQLATLDLRQYKGWRRRLANLKVRGTRARTKTATAMAARELTKAGAR